MTHFHLFRYELREDRKRETVRNSSNMDSLKRDIIRSVRSLSVTGQPHSPIIGGRSSVHTSPKNVGSYQDMPMVMDPADMDYLKHEIISSLRAEIRDIARELVTTTQTAKDVQNAVPSPINSELYHTHLYTQL